MSTIFAVAQNWPWMRSGALALTVWVFASGCGDVAQSSGDDGAAACDASYCVDCADPCCFDLGYC